MTGNGAYSVGNGVMADANKWYSYSFDEGILPTEISNDMLKGVATGTTARTRIGNKINVKYLKGAFTFTAGTVIVTNYSTRLAMQTRTNKAARHLPGQRKHKCSNICELHTAL